jgi:hypothetical protein
VGDGGARLWDRGMQQDTGQLPTNRRRLTVVEAADILGISPEAVRARIKRDPLVEEKDPDGIVYVQVDGDQTQRNDGGAGDEIITPSRQDGTSETADQIGLIEALQAEVKFLPGELQGREVIHTKEARRRTPSSWPWYRVSRS